MRRISRTEKEADALRLADADARRLAVSEFVVPVALEAGAGTGKTRALVARLATWLLGPGWSLAEVEVAAANAGFGRESDPADVAVRAAEGVVAITFTEAAAAEMARRLGTLLLALAAGARAADLEPLPGLLEGVDLAPRARSLSAALSRVRIQTIHGFCHGLLAEHPFEARLHPALEVDADGSRVAGAARASLLEKLRSRDESLLSLVASGADPLEIHEAIVLLLGAGATHRDFDSPRFTASSCELLLESLAGAVREFLLRLEPLVAATKKLRRAGQVATALQQLASAAESGEIDPLRRLELLREALPDLAEAWTSAFTDWNRSKLNKTEEELLGEAREAYLAAARGAGEQIAFLQRADPSAFEKARLALAPLLAETRERLRRSGTLTFDDLLGEAVALLRGNPALRKRIRRSIRQLLVDEFQDTDRRQCELLRQLVLVEGANDRPGLFVVGDPKQSIYAWRSADLAAYQGFLDELRAAGGVDGRLAVNFRSVPPVLDEVERSIAPAMTYEESIQPAFEPLLASPANADARGFDRHSRAPVEFWLSWDEEAVASGEAPRAGRAAEIEAAAIAADVAELARTHGVAWHEFAILLRTRGHLEVYLEALRRAGIPYAVQNDRSYYRRREVIDLLSLVRLVLDPGDDLARVAALRSPFVGVPDAAWLPLASAGFDAALRELDGPDGRALAVAQRAIAEAAAALPPQTREIPGFSELADWPAALAEAVTNVARLRAEWRTLPVAIWLERLRSRFLVEPIAAARYLGRFGLANVERLFGEIEVALAEAADPLAALAILRRAVEENLDAEEARPPESQPDAVSVLTIHTAKGLEFGHVYLAQAHKAPLARRGRVAAALLRNAPESPAEMELFGHPSPGWRAACTASERAREAETARLLYVAMTRARTRLVICGLWNRDESAAPPRRSFLALLAARRPRDLEALFRSGELPAISDPVLWRRPVPSARTPPTAGAVEPGAAPNDPDSGDPANAPRSTIPVEDRRRAAARQKRDRFRSASAHEIVDDFEPLRRVTRNAGVASEERGDGTRREIAQARGLGFHRALELASSVGADERIDSASRATYVAARPGAGAEELARFAEELSRLRDSMLWQRLRELAPHVLARELPLLVASDDALDTGPVDGYLGTLDLLYRDPATGELVIADFKSDPVPDESNESWTEELLQRYRSQLELYGRAVDRVLSPASKPRLELWLLAADRIAVLPRKSSSR